MDKQWWKESVIYQIYPRSFYDTDGDGIGDLRGIIEKLDYVKELGANVIWLNPVYESPNDDNGYDISDYYRIMKDFGTMEDWEELLREMHKRDMKLVMDLVVNHTSDEHAWFVESRKSKDSPYRDYYIWRPGKDGKEPNNWEAVFGGSVWEYDEMTGEYYLHLFSRKQPDLNWENPKVREEVYKMMTWWLDKGVDGFRMDVINLISKDPNLPDAPIQPGKRYANGGQYYVNGPRVHEFLQEMNEKVLSKYDMMTVGEAPGATVKDAKLYTDPKRNELNMVFTFEHMDVDGGPGGKWELRPLKLTKLKEILSKWQTGLHGVGWNSLYWNNHDQPRIVSRFGNDQEYRVVSAKMLGTVLHMMEGTPYIYQGEEIGMTNVHFDSIEDYRDIETLNMYREKMDFEKWDEKKIMESIYAKGRDNARTPMQWDDTENAGFTKGTPWIKVNPNFKEINVKNALADPNSIFYHYQKLIQLRKTYPVIVYGDYTLLAEDSEEVFAYIRSLDGVKLLVISNWTNEEVSFTMPEKEEFYPEKILISNYPDPEENPGETILLRPWEAIVYLGK